MDLETCKGGHRGGYITVVVNSQDELEAEVNKLIAEGWAPMGGVSVALDRQSHKCWCKVGPVDITYVYAQAMMYRGKGSVVTHFNPTIVEVRQ